MIKVVCLKEGKKGNSKLKLILSLRQYLYASFFLVSENRTRGMRVRSVQSVETVNTL